MSELGTLERKAETLKKIGDFINRLTRMHQEAHQIGLHRTGHKLHEVVQEVGYEAADILSGKQKLGKNQ